jgi:hypothetical protein
MKGGERREAEPPPDGDPAAPPTETAASPRPSRRRRTAGDRRATVDTPTPAADDSGAVIVEPHDFRLPDVLRRIEAGKVVLVMPHHPSDD